MITLTITTENIEEAFNNHLQKILKDDGYNNPIKHSFEKLIGYSGDQEVKDKIDAVVKDFTLNYLETSEFRAAVGKEMAVQIAKKGLERKDKIR